MNISEFKENTLNAIIRHGNRMFGPMALATVILYVLSIVTVLLVFVAMFNVSVEDMEVFSDPAVAPKTPEEIMGVMTAMFGSISAMYASLGVFMFIMIFFSSWVIHLMLQISDAKINGSSFALGTAFSKSFDKGVWRIMGVTFLLWVGMIIIYLIGTMLLGAIFASKPGLLVTFSILFFIFIYILGFRFLAVCSAIVHGNMNIMDALSFSWNNITWKRSILIFFLLIAVAFGLGLVMALLVSVLAGISDSPFIMMITMLAFVILIYAYGISALSALYYRYSDDTGLEDIDHLVELESNE